MNASDIFTTIFLCALALLVLGIGLKKSGAFVRMIESLAKMYAEEENWAEVANILLSGVYFNILDDEEYRRLSSRYLPVDMVHS